MITGKQLTLFVDIPGSQEIKGDLHHYNITDDKGGIVGNEYTICLEDATDNDHNDVAVSIIGWKNKG